MTLPPPPHPALLPSTARGRWALLAIVIVAAALRWAGMDWGLPSATHLFPFHPDELTNINAPRRMLESGDLNPRFFHYGSLYSYLVWLAYLPCRALGGLEQTATYFWIGRLVVLGCALLTLPVLFAIGRLLGGERLGLIAAALLAVTPAHVMHGAFATVDVPSILFAALSLWLALRALEATATPRRWLVFGATVCCGLAAATKYPMGIVGLASLVAIGLARVDTPRERAGDAAVAVLGGAVGFLLGCPYAVLDFSAFWRDLHYELFEHAVQGHGELFAATGNGWWFTFTQNLPYVMGPVLLLIGLVGTATLTRARPRAGLVLLAFAVPYFAMLGAVQIRFMRYSLALAPVLCLGAAFVLQGIWRRGTMGHRAAAAALAVLVVLPTLVQTAAFAREDPRLAAVQLLVERSAPDDRVGALMHPGWFSVPLTRFNGGRPARAYGQVDDGPLTLTVTEGWQPDALRQTAPEWFALTEFWWSFEDTMAGGGRRAFLGALDRDYELVFGDAGYRKSLRWLFGNPHPPHDWLYPFPEVRVYQRRSPQRAVAAPGR
ncbi:MAG: glycosyltransferase family 39 protein [Planctomycetota bacterium]